MTNHTSHVKSSIEAALDNLQEFGFIINELKRDGKNSVSIENYEYLLNWTIDAMAEIKDKMFT